MSVDASPPLPGAAGQLAATVPWKVTRRLLPFLFVLYVLNILDRANISMAKIRMPPWMDAAVFGLGIGIFYLGYSLLEIPSNLILRRTGARRWIARIMVSWGIISAGMMFVTGPWSFYLLRFLLGVAEAGFFPGIILYMSYWFPARERARAVACFMAASPLTGVLGNPLSGAIMDSMHGLADVQGWQWLFLLEGIPSVVMGLVVLSYLTDRPEQAGWLTPAERGWLSERMAGEEKRREQHHPLTLLGSLANPGVWLLCLIYVTAAMGSNGVGFYSPTLLDEHFRGATGFQIGLLTAVPNLAAIVGMVLVGASSDRSGERRWHIAGSAVVAAAGWCLLALASGASDPLAHVLDSAAAPDRSFLGLKPDQWLVLGGLTLAQTGVMCMLPTFWALPTSFLSGAAAAGGIALINSIGNLGGFVAPNVLGQVKAATGSFAGGMYFLAGALVLGGCLVLCARHNPTLEQHEATTAKKEADAALSSS
jgi:ACS family tartrate transporter-like MFS transporter